MNPALIQPLGDRVLVETIDEAETTAGGVVIPDLVREARPERARVLAVGPGRYSEKTGQLLPMPVQVGDEVIFHRMAGSHIGGLDDHFIIFREQDLLALIHPEPA